MMFACMSGFSYSSEKLVKMRNYVATVSNEADLVFVVCWEITSTFIHGAFISIFCLIQAITFLACHFFQVGAMAHGKIDSDYTEDLLASKLIASVFSLLILLGLLRKGNGWGGGTWTCRFIIGIVYYPLIETIKLELNSVMLKKSPAHFWTASNRSASNRRVGTNNFLMQHNWI